jgi:hypothetical protein
VDSDAEENFWEEDDGYPAGEEDTDRDTDYEPDYIPPVHHPTDNSFDSDPTPSPSMAAGGREELPRHASSTKKLPASPGEDLPRPPPWLDERDEVWCLQQKVWGYLGVPDVMTTGQAMVDDLSAGLVRASPTSKAAFAEVLACSMKEFETRWFEAAGRAFAIARALAVADVKEAFCAEMGDLRWEKTGSAGEWAPNDSDDGQERDDGGGDTGTKVGESTGGDGDGDDHVNDGHRKARSGRGEEGNAGTVAAETSRLTVSTDGGDGVEGGDGKDNGPPQKGPRRQQRRRIMIAIRAFRPG